MNRTLKVLRLNLASGGFATENVTNTSATVKPSGLIPVYGRQVHDAILFVVTCPTHHKMLLKEVKKGIYYMPFFPLKLSKLSPHFH